jgi:tetrahydromethanopterin S-methyltransferase subunit G
MNVIQDPNLKVTAADWNEQQKFLNNISNEVSEIHKSIIAMRKVKKTGRNI